MAPEPTTAASAPSLRFDEAGTGSGPTTCAQCQASITTVYFEVNGHVVCAGCKQGFEREPAGSGATRLIRAGLFGFGGAVLGAALYYAILATTGYELGLVAIAVGWLVGRAVQKGSNGAGGWPYQAIAVGLTYLAIVSTYVPFMLKAMDDRASPAVAAASSTDSAAALTPARPATPEAVTPPPAPADSAAAGSSPSVGRFVVGLLALVALAMASPFLAGFENILGLIIIGFALYQAWKMNRRVQLSFSGPYRVQTGAGGRETGDATRE